MADAAAARRDARRKRILENSENRLRIISGLVKVDDSGDEPLKGNDGSVWTSPVLAHEPKHSVLQPNPTENTWLQGNLSASPGKELEEAEFSTETENYSLDPLITVKASPTGSTLQQSEVQTTLAATIFAARLHLVGVALLVRLLLSSNYGYLFGESVFAPLITIQLVKYWGIGNDSQNTKSHSGILYVILMLSGMPARQTSLLKRTVAGVKDFLQDFYIYFFSFIILHILLQFSAL